MQAVTEHQPFASLVAVGAKTILTRGRRAPPDAIGQPLAIHAAASIPWSVRRDVLGHAPRGQSRTEFAGSTMILNALYRHGLSPSARYNDGPHPPLPLGAVVASATLIDVVPTDELQGDGFEIEFIAANGSDEHSILAIDVPEDRDDVWCILNERPFGDFSPGRFAWLLGDVAPTTTRCPWCWGEGVEYGPTPDPSPRGLPVRDLPQRACPVCSGVRSCEPVLARGKQGLWDWAGSANE